MDISTPEGMKLAIAWQQNHISMIRDGGIWIVPRSATTVIINHKSKTAIFSSNSEPDIEKVFRAMGWSVRV